MRKLTKIILPEVEVEDLKIRPRGDNRCESAKYACMWHRPACTETIAIPFHLLRSRAPVGDN